MPLKVKVVLWPELETLATSNKRRKKFEAIQAKIAGRFSNQDLPVFRLILAEGTARFREPDDVAQLGEAFPNILFQTYEGSEATPLGHERSYNEEKILDALRSSNTLHEFLGQFKPGFAPPQPKTRKPLFRRVLAADVPGGNSHLSMEQDRYEACFTYRGRPQLLKIINCLGIEMPTVPPAEQRLLRNTCQEIIGFPDLSQPGEISLLDLPVRISIHGNADGSGEIVLMIIDAPLPTERQFSLPDRVKEIEILLAEV